MMNVSIKILIIIVFIGCGLQVGVSKLSKKPITTQECRSKTKRKTVLQKKYCQAIGVPNSDIRNQYSILDTSINEVTAVDDELTEQLSQRRLSFRTRSVENLSDHSHQPEREDVDKSNRPTAGDEVQETDQLTVGDKKRRRKERKSHMKKQTDLVEASGGKEVSFSPCFGKDNIKATVRGKRITSVHASLSTKDLGTGTGTNKGSRAQLQSQGQKEDDIAGHIIANQTGGCGHGYIGAVNYNIIPLNTRVNNQMLHGVEKIVRKELDRGNNVEVDVSMKYYEDNLTQRPDEIQYHVKFSNGTSKDYYYKNEEPENFKDGRNAAADAA